MTDGAGDASVQEPTDAARGGVDEHATDRILTIPNAITVARLALLPVFLWLLFSREERVQAALLLAAIGVTDFLDGWLARRWNQISELGKILDPVADRLLFFVGGGAILIDGSVPVWFAVAVLVREALVAIATVGLAALGAARIDVTWFGKAGAFALMVAFPWFLASAADVGWAGTAEVLAWGFGIPGLVLAWYSAALYLPLARRALREGRAEQPGVPSAP